MSTAINIANPQPEIKRHLALGLDPRDVQDLSRYQQPLQPPAETVHGFSLPTLALSAMRAPHPTR